jgi:hypothetical protein
LGNPTRLKVKQVDYFKEIGKHLEARLAGTNLL